jgi:flagellar capping protein FliD
LGQTNLDILQVPANPAFASPQQTTAAGGYAVSQTTASWDASDPIPATYTLTIGGNQYSINPASNTADDVALAINNNYGGQVRASVVDLGTSTSPDKRIYLQSTTDDGTVTLDLQKNGGPSLQTQQIAATSRTASSWDAADDPAGSRSTYHLVVGSNTYSFTPADNKAPSVVAAINSLYGGQVHASVVDLETGGSPDFRISLQSPTGSSTPLDLQKTTVTSFQKEQTAGSLASYEMIGSGVTNTSTTRNIAVSDGITATLLAPTDGPVDITVTRSTATLGTALSAFADAYNAVVDELGTQRGSAAGPLGGQSIVSQLSGILSGISTYSSGGQINILKDLGLELDKNGTINGHLTYSFTDFMNANYGNSAGVASFLGSTTGGGFLKNAADALNQVEKATTGMLKSSETNWQTQITNLGTTISAKQNQVVQLQLRLQNQMAASDALIASMEQQASYFSSMFAAQQTANQMYK